MLKDELEKLKKDWAARIMLSSGGDSASELFLRRVDIIEALFDERESKLKKQNAALREENDVIRGLIGASDVEVKSKLLSLVEETRFLREGITDFKNEAASLAKSVEAERADKEIMKRDALIVEDIHKKELDRLREIITSSEKNLARIVGEWNNKFDGVSNELRAQSSLYRRRLESASAELWGFSQVVLDGWVTHARDTLGAVFGATDYLSACIDQKGYSVGKLKKDIGPDIKLIKDKTALAVGTFNKMAEFFSVRPEYKKTDINSIFRRLKEKYSRLFGLNVKWPDEKEYPPLVCDESLIAGALSEIIANSADALGGDDARSGSIDITLSCDDTFFAVEAGDSGPGIPPENEEKLFTPFFTTKPGRDGLGLVRAKRNVLFHAGEILYSSGKFRFKISHE